METHEVTEGQKGASETLHPRHYYEANRPVPDMCSQPPQTALVHPGGRGRCNSYRRPRRTHQVTYARSNRILSAIDQGDHQAPTNSCRLV